MIKNNLINVENCIPQGYKYNVSCSTGDIIMPNEIVVADNINAALSSIQSTILTLDKYSCELYDYIEYFGWLGPNPEDLVTNAAALSACRKLYWEDIDCVTPTTGIISWGDLECTNNPADANTNLCKEYKAHECKRVSCFGKYCTDWNWKSRSSQDAVLPITWKMTKEDGVYEKLWMHESCELNDSTQCDEGFWHVNIPLIDDLYEPVGNCDLIRRCAYTGIASRDNILYVSGRTTIKVLSSDYDATELGIRTILDQSTGFGDICGLALDSHNTIFVVDKHLHKVAGFTFNQANTNPWALTVTWGGAGSAASTNRFLRPNDIHIDINDNVWVADTGNKCVKQYTNTGNWIQTIVDSYFNTSPPLSMAVDEKDQVHILTQNSVRVYDYNGNFIFTYLIDTSSKPIKINTNFNKQILYVTYINFVRKYVRTGLSFDYLFNQKPCVDYINSIYQDEFRNTLVTFGDKIIKYVHIVKQRRSRSELATAFWSIDNILIHKEEYIQNWVYNKAFQRMWDNIELFRLSLYYDGTYCKGYKPPVYKKEDIFIGQNEIVTSVVINRCLEYLWANLCTLINFYYNPDCKEPETFTPVCPQPVVTWSTQADLARWDLTVNNTVARLVINDDCPIPGGPLPVAPPTTPTGTTFFGAATATIVTPPVCNYTLDINLIGSSITTAPQISLKQETFKVTYQGIDVLEAHPLGTLPLNVCGNTTANITTLAPTKYTLLPNSTYKLVCSTYNDAPILGITGPYTGQHKDSFYEVQLSFT
jgi:hypothetical protein